MLAHPSAVGTKGDAQLHGLNTMHHAHMQHCVHGLITIDGLGLYHNLELAAWGYHVTEGEEFTVIFAAGAAVSSHLTHGCKLSTQSGAFTEDFLLSAFVNEKFSGLMQVCSTGRSRVRKCLLTLQLQRSLVS